MKEVKNRAYWESNSSVESMNLLDQIFNDLGDVVNDVSLRYQTASYIGVESDNKARNFISFTPKRDEMISMAFYLSESVPNEDLIKQLGVEYHHDHRKRYHLILNETKLNMVILRQLANRARDEYPLLYRQHFKDI